MILCKSIIYSSQRFLSLSYAALDRKVCLKNIFTDCFLGGTYRKKLHDVAFSGPLHDVIL